MKSSRKRLLLIMLGVAIALVLVGIVAQPLINANTTVQARADNAILSGLGFILMFIGIIVAFIDLITFMATLLNHNVPERLYNPILNVLIAGVVLGVIGMFQPFLFVLYQIGFLMLFVSLIGFMVWSHIVPKSERRQEKLDGAAAGRS